MKQSIPNPKLLCCASIFALSLAACSQNPGKLKPGTQLADSSGQSNQLVKLKKGHRSKKLGLALPDPRSYDNLWDRLFDRFDLPVVDHPDVDRELSWFINHPTYIERVQSRAEPFLYSIVKQLEKQNLPGELALLPVIESAFQPHVVSPAHAAGIWQFIPATGRHYGLKQSHSYDGRRDIYASTRAAIKYLKKMHNQFNGDWLLAIAGYNCGEGAVSRAMQRNAARGLPTDFWSLDLPHETRTYVPRLLAVAKLFSESERYGFSLRTIPNKALYKTVKMNDHIDLALAANAADISLDRLFELNPGFKRQQVDLDGSYRLFIPAHKKIVDFKEELARQMAASKGEEVLASSAADRAGLATDALPVVEAQAQTSKKKFKPSDTFRIESTTDSLKADSSNVAEPAQESRSSEDSKPSAPADVAEPLAEPALSEVGQPSSALAGYGAVNPTPEDVPAEEPKPTASSTGGIISEPLAAEFTLPAEQPAPVADDSAQMAQAHKEGSRPLASAGELSRQAYQPAGSFAGEDSSTHSTKPNRQQFDSQNSMKPKMVSYQATQPAYVDALSPTLKVKDYGQIAVALAKETAPPPHLKSGAVVQSAQKIRGEASIAGRIKPLPDAGAHKEELSTSKATVRGGATGNDISAATTHRQPEQQSLAKKSAYRVQEGDTLYSIARRHDMDVDELKKINRLASADDINYGQTLLVSGREREEKEIAGSSTKETTKKSAAAKASAGLSGKATAVQASRYTAHDGETLFSISRRFNVTVADLRKWNGIKEDKQFRAGMNITVTGDKN